MATSEVSVFKVVLFEVQKHASIRKCGNLLKVFVFHDRILAHCRMRVKWLATDVVNQLVYSENTSLGT